MDYSRPNELIRAEKLMYNGKLEESYGIITDFEKKADLTREDQLSLLLIKGKYCSIREQYKKAVEIGEVSYKLSNELGMLSEMIEALTLKASISLSGNFEEAIKLIVEAEKLLSSLDGISSSHLSRLKLGILYIKAGTYFLMGSNEAPELAQEGLALAEKNKNFTFIVGFLVTLGWIYMTEPDKALDYTIKSLNLCEKLNFKLGIGGSLSLMCGIYSTKGDFNLALDFGKRSLALKELGPFSKANTLVALGGIYREKGELEKALKYYKQGIKLSEEKGFFSSLVMALTRTGTTYRMKGDYKQALKYIKQDITLTEKTIKREVGPFSLFDLFLIHLESNSNKLAQQTLDSLKELTDRYRHKWASQIYLLAKALLLKTKNRARYKAEAENILKQIIDDDISHTQIYIFSLVSLCELLFEELSEYNELEILDELDPLIARLLVIAEDQNSYLYLAEGKLLQAKLALIQMDFDKAKLFFTQAQRIAEMHGLNLLAHKISIEHDTLLEQIKEWENLKKNDAPMAERIELASVDGVIDRLQGKRAVEPSELVDEEPILLLIMDNSGATYFSHSFISNWDFSDLFSSFMSAFNTFMDEIFSKSIDRIRVGENTILINPVEPFLTCYVIKGQSYPALQKLARFTEAIRENPEIWEALNKSIKTSEMLELDKPPGLKIIIDDIFTG
ncbi:MAG: tetratricopeptide repeat protein [Candidatus Thorarchaeota archaeon]